MDRCQSCHVAINRDGFDDLAHPLKTHPKRRVFLSDAAHPPRIFGCTTCHDGQGEGINSLAQAHGNVKFWSIRCSRATTCRPTALPATSTSKALRAPTWWGRGQRIFEQVGCTGCHLVEGYDDIPKVGPSLRRVRAKVDPGWMVQWILNPRAFRPHTRMPHFFFEEDEALAAASYLWSASKKEAGAWAQGASGARGLPVRRRGHGEEGRGVGPFGGCRGVTALPRRVTTRIGGKDLVPNLKDIAAKVNPRWAYNWWRNPKRYNPDTRMPSLGCPKTRRWPSTTYLMTLGTKPEPNAALVARLEQPANIARGEKLVRKYGCAVATTSPGWEKESGSASS